MTVEWQVWHPRFWSGTHTNPARSGMLFAVRYHRAKLATQPAEETESSCAKIIQAQACFIAPILHREIFFSNLHFVVDFCA
ncbi:MAG: hypothetical protein NTZ98_06245 [Acidobacteria bacterium]|nr:hypothetical protein [Acidobacteriota bacterium]